MKLSILLAMTTLTLLACGHKRPDHPAEQVAVEKPSTAQQQDYKSDCDEQKEALKLRTDLVQEPAAKVSIERHYQRVIRKDCAGNVVSDGVETVKSPTTDYVTWPVSGLKGKAGKVHLFNADTCANGNTPLPNTNWNIVGLFFSVTGNVDGKIRIKMDMSDGTFTFRVHEGENNIYYEYRDEAGQEVGAGLYRITVAYSEKHLDGFQTVQATECPASK
jgi:hypothetical protein